MNLVEVERRTPVRFVRLDTGPKNILGREAIEALLAAISPDREAPVVVLSGRTDAFCAGLDGAVLAQADVEAEELLTVMGELLLAAISGPTRIVAACEGPAVAAGAMLLLVSDVRIGARGDYEIGFTEPRIGMALPHLAAVLARARLDRTRLHALTILGRTPGPEEAAAAGFLDEVVDASELEAIAHKRALEIAALSAAAYSGTLEAVWGAEIEQIRSLVNEQAFRRDIARANPA